LHVVAVCPEHAGWLGVHTSGLQVAGDDVESQ
jgi:hypothetical protein